MQVYRLITKGTVDQNIYNLSQRKLRMDSAVLDGITSGKGGKADESAQMGFILHVRGPPWLGGPCVQLQHARQMLSKAAGCITCMPAPRSPPAPHAMCVLIPLSCPVPNLPLCSRSLCLRSMQRATRPTVPRCDVPCALLQNELTSFNLP